MKTSGKFFEALFYGMLFGMGMMLFIQQGRVFYQTYQKVKDTVTAEDIVYQNTEVSSQAVDVEMVSKSELILTLEEELSYDVSIDGVRYKKEEFEPTSINYSALQAFYKKHYAYNEAGMIVAVCYEAKEGVP